MPDNFAGSPDGLLLVANGIDRPLRWDGLSDEMEEAGVLAPAAKVTLAASGSGTITGTYYGYLRFVDENGSVSDVSPISAAVVAASKGTITYTGVGLPTESKVVKRQLLRNTAGQATVFYVDVETTDLSGSSFTSTKTDSQLQAGAALAFLDGKGNPLVALHAVPPDTKAVVASHLDRMFLAGEEVYRQGCVKVTLNSKTVQGYGTEWPATFAGRFLWVAGAEQSYEIASVSTANQTLTLLEAYLGLTDPYAEYAVRPELPQRRLVAFSEAGQPESWPPTNAVSVQEDGDEITGLMPKGSFLYILERRHTYKLTFEANPSEDGTVFLGAGRGCVNNRCWAVVDERAFLLDEAGAYSHSPQQGVENLSDPIQDIFEPASRSRRGGPARHRIRWPASRWFHCCYDPSLRVVRWFVTLEGTGLPRHALCLEVTRSAWWIEEYPFPVGSSCVGLLRGERRVLLGGPGGKVFALGEGTLDVVDADRTTARGGVSSATPTSLTDLSAAFAVEAEGAPVTIVSGRGKGQTRNVLSVTDTTLRLDRPWMVRPDATSVYQIGGVQFRYRTGWFRWVNLDEENRRRLEVQFEPTESETLLDARMYQDRGAAPIPWGATQAGADVDGFGSAKDDPDWTASMTKEIGQVQRAIDGRKDTYLDGPRMASWELAGATNRDEVTIYQVTIDGVRGPG